MKTLGMILGVVGLLALIISPGFGVILLIVGALMFMVGARQQRVSVEERRHQEILAATREKKY